MGDARLERGYVRQARLLADRLAAGEHLRGWKAGFGSASAFASLGIDAPLVSFLLTSAAVPNASTVTLEEWVTPLCEPEIAVELATDVASGADPVPAVGRTFPAFELADLVFPPSEPEAILAAGVYQRHYILGAGGRSGFSVEGLIGEVRVNGVTEGPVSDLTTAAGEQATVLRHVSSVAHDRHGRGLRAGDIVLLGSIIPPIRVSPGDRVEYRLGDLGELAVTFR